MFLMPTFVLVVLLNQIDRHNISYAALTMNRSVAVADWCVVIINGHPVSIYGQHKTVVLHTANTGQLVITCQRSCFQIIQRFAC